MPDPDNGFVAEQIRASIAVKQALLDDAALLAQIEAVAGLIVATYRNGGKVLIAGNGGSAADAQHIAAELVSRFTFDRPALPALALTTDTSILTGIGNDYGYDSLFSRQVEASGRPGDVFIGISTSGNSPNILRALEAARAGRLVTVGLGGATGGRMGPLCDHCLKMPSTDTPRIQECHITVGHILCANTENALFGAPSDAAG
ncbi:MAG: D-sedoheptulose 7-phosphate isomerase [Gammaproteobacteria bacterium]|nr:D-sedoheptulose 7-phosphate isomerase [Gammaproteobacteria bacterium]